MEQARATDSFADLTVAQFIEKLSSSEPVPGGGSASALAAALGASLISMVAALSTGRPKYAAYEATLARSAANGRELSAEFLRLADLDANAYAGYAAALKMPREAEDQQAIRREAIRTAARSAAEAPLECVLACASLVESALALAGRSNVNAASDVLVASLLAEAAARGAAENVLINLPSIDDEEYSQAMRHQVDSALHEIGATAARVREIVLSGQAQDPEAE